MITAIDLRNCLQRGQSQPGGLFIITTFNKLDIAFHVDSVVGIHRVSWVDIIKPGATVTTAEDGISTGIIKIDGKLIIILDFEKIVSDINPETGLKVTDIDALGTRNGTSVPILIAEDSSLLRKLIVDSLKKSGYDNVIKTENGEEAWEYICKYRDEGTLDDNVKLLITDIEMPLMDGHRLTKLVKSDEDTKHIPVVIFSSLVNDEMKKKGDELGADAQLSKPEIGNLVKVIDRLLENK
jgi:two-component system chemotaxis response regulator CheV